MMSDEKKLKNEQKPPQQWDEARVIVLLIGISLMIEGGLIYFQAGSSQMVVSGVTAVAGLTLLLFAWFVPLDEESIDELSTDLEDDKKEAITDKTAVEIEKKEEPKEKVTLESEAVEEKKPEAADKKIEEVAPEAEAPKEEKAVVEEKPVVEEEPELTWFQRLTRGLTKTRTGFVGKLKKLVLGKTEIDEELLDELEETLFEADVGVKTTQELLEVLHKKVEEEEIKEPQKIYEILKEQLKAKLTRFSSDPKLNPDGLTVFLIIGVNGVGKTTTIAKLAHKYISEGKKVVLAAGDTFRAAAIDQLTIWGERVGAEVIRGTEGGDPGALAFDAIHAAKKREADILIIDTAGRMHVKANLMAELKKVEKIAEKESDGGPHEVLLVLDATTGQNAVQQAKLFNEAIPISGLVITKLDGTAKGGVLFAVEEQINAPVKFIGVGEKMNDLMSFDPEQFLEALFSDDSEKTKQSDYEVL